MEPETHSSVSMRFRVLELHLSLKISFASGLLNCIHLKNILTNIMCSNLSLQGKDKAEAGT